MHNRKTIAQQYGLVKPNIEFQLYDGFLESLCVWPTPPFGMQLCLNMKCSIYCTCILTLSISIFTYLHISIHIDCHSKQCITKQRRQQQKEYQICCFVCVSMLSHRDRSEFLELQISKSGYDWILLNRSALRIANSLDISSTFFNLFTEEIDKNTI